MHTVLLNSERRAFTRADLPLLVHGKEGSGASLFTIVLAADLARAGEQIVLWSAYPMAKRALEEELGEDVFNVTMLAEGERALMEALPSVSVGRILVVKNCETLSTSALEAVTGLPTVIASGDLDAVKASAWDGFRTKVLFSPGLHPVAAMPPLAKYEAFLMGATEGVVRVSTVT